MAELVFKKEELHGLCEVMENFEELIEELYEESDDVENINNIIEQVGSVFDTLEDLLWDSLSNLNNNGNTQATLELNESQVNLMNLVKELTSNVELTSDILEEALGKFIEGNLK